MQNNLRFFMFIIVAISSNIHGFDKRLPVPMINVVGKIPTQFDGPVSDGVRSSKAIKYLEDNYKKILIDSQRFRLVDDSLMELYWETDRQVLVDGHDIDHFLSLLVKENGKYMVLIQRLLDLDFNVVVSDTQSISILDLDQLNHEKINHKLRHLVYRFVNHLPSDGYILSASQSLYTVSMGARHGLSVGDRLDISRDFISTIHPATKTWHKFRKVPVGWGKLIEVGRETSVLQLKYQSEGSAGNDSRGSVKIGDGIIVESLPSRSWFKKKENNRSHSFKTPINIDSPINTNQPQDSHKNYINFESKEFSSKKEEVSTPSNKEKESKKSKKNKIETASSHHSEKRNHTKQKKKTFKNNKKQASGLIENQPLEQNSQHIKLGARYEVQDFSGVIRNELTTSLPSSYFEIQMAPFRNIYTVISLSYRNQLSLDNTNFTHQNYQFTLLYNANSSINRNLGKINLGASFENQQLNVSKGSFGGYNYDVYKIVLHYETQTFKVSNQVKLSGFLRLNRGVLFQGNWGILGETRSILDLSDRKFEYGIYITKLQSHYKLELLGALTSIEQGVTSQERLSQVVSGYGFSISRNI